MIRIDDTKYHIECTYSQVERWNYRIPTYLSSIQHQNLTLSPPPPSHTHTNIHCWFISNDLNETYSKSLKLIPVSNQLEKDTEKKINSGTHTILGLLRMDEKCIHLQQLSLSLSHHKSCPLYINPRPPWSEHLDTRVSGCKAGNDWGQWYI